MRVSLGWLAEWIDLPPDSDALAERLTMAGLEVDAIERQGPDLSEIVVGEVVERGAHPSADRLALCRVDVGEGEPVAIVCGAPNVAAGQKVAVACPGTKLPDGTKIKKSKIRGEVSLGMICSGRELGLSEDHEGILVLDRDASVGESVEAYVASGDTVLEIAILPNRGDCASMIGMAREIQAATGATIRCPETAPEEGDREAAQDIEVEIGDPAGCARYDARVVRDVKVEASDSFVGERLEASGLHPVNNAVDIANEVMLEWGQPLHVFDLDRVRGSKVVVRSAEPGETLVTLDGKERRLESDDLVVADEGGPIALAGVMGGRDSEVTAETCHVLIESAVFDPSRVRRTARRHGIASDASYRFERGVDRAGSARAANRAARLIAERAGGRVSRGIVAVEGQARPVPAEIELDVGRANRLLGADISESEFADLLERLGVESRSGAGGILVARIPTHRNDLTRPEDLVEEVARLYGFDRIEPREPRVEPGRAERPAASRLADRARDALCGEGLFEVLCFPFSDPGDMDQLRLDPEDPRRETVSLLNPVVERESCLRSTLVASLIRLACENFNRQADAVAIFEVARVFRRSPTPSRAAENLRACAFLTRRVEPGLWDRSDVPIFFEAKGIAERLCTSLGRGPVRTEGTGAESFLHPSASTSLVLGRQVVGSVGEVHPATAQAFGLPCPGVLVDIDLDAFAQLPERAARYTAVSRHPQVRRDLAFLLSRDQSAGEVVEAIRKEAGTSLVGVEVFDRYEGKGVPEGRVSVAFRLVLQRSDRTLKDAEVVKVIDRIIQKVAQRFDAELR